MRRPSAGSASKGAVGPERASRYRRPQFCCDGRSLRCWDHLGLDAAATPAAHPRLLYLATVSPRTAARMQTQPRALWWAATSRAPQPMDHCGEPGVKASSGARCRTPCPAGEAAGRALRKAAGSKQPTRSGAGLCQQSEPRNPAFAQTRAAPRGDAAANPGHSLCSRDLRQPKV